jgi:hypothetical protein
VTSAPEVLAAGREPRRRLRAGPAVSPRARRVLVAAGAVLLVVAAAASWSAGRSALAPTVHVAVDRSEYTLPHPADADGHAPLLLLLRVDAARATSDRLAVTAIDGGGVTAAGTYPVATNGTHRAVVRATVSCPEWTGGAGVRVRVAVGSGSGAVTREATLDLGPGEPLHAQVDETCARWRAARAPGGVLLVGGDQGRSLREADLESLIAPVG